MQLLSGIQPLGSEDIQSTQNVNAQSLSVRVFTHNIRYATSSPSKNERQWQERFPLIMNQIFYHTRFISTGGENEKGSRTTASSSGNYAATFICMQEVLRNQLYDILGSLNNIDDKAENHGSQQKLPNGPVWSHIGVARDDGKTRGEYGPILYPTKLFDLLHFENTWLSPTLDKPSRGWDAALPQILTSAVFEHKATKRRIAVFNTLLDHAGTVAREKSIGVILKVIDRITTQWRRSTATSSSSNDERLDYILTGDFNSFPTQEAYKAMVKSDTSVDVHQTVSARQRYGSEITFTGFEPDTDKDKGEIGRIDYIWLGPKGRVHGPDVSISKTKGWHVQGYSVLPNVFDDGVFCSDHRCVVADAILM